MANPIFIPEVFAKNGLKNDIQKTLQSGQDVQDMTWSAGTPLITMTPIDDNGKAPKGQDFNGVLNALCDNIVHTQNSNRYKWSTDVISNYGGYDKDAIVQSDDGIREYRSLVDNNTTNPNNGIGATWLVYAGAGSVPNATSTTAGIMRVLNTLASTDVGSALSAAQGKVIADAFGNNLSTSGDQNIFGGLQFSWGSTELPGGLTTNLNFPNAFRTNCVAVFTTLKVPAVGNVNAEPLSRSSFRVQTVGYTASQRFQWFAIGF